LTIVTIYYITFSAAAIGHIVASITQVAADGKASTTIFNPALNTNARAGNVVAAVAGITILAGVT